MKKIAWMLAISMLFVSGSAHATGDLTVDGKLGVGTGTAISEARLEVAQSDGRSKMIIRGMGDGWNYGEISFRNTINSSSWNFINRQYSDYPGGFTMEEYNGLDYKSRIAINAGTENSGRIYLNPLHNGGVSIGSDFKSPAIIGGATRLGDLHVYGKDAALIEFDGVGDGTNYAILTLEAHVPSLNYPHWSIIHRQKNDIGGQANGLGFEYWNGSTYDIKMAVTKDGNIGIGTISPNQKLHLYGTSNTLMHIEGGPATTSNGIKMTTNGNVMFISNENGRMGFFNTSSERMSITSSGNVGIGTTAISSGQKLEVNGGVSINTTTAQPTCSSTTRGTFWVKQGASGVKDSVQVCAKDAANAYSWRTLY
ncbi:MAG: hypothetical protein HY758_08770 [Nitrospirae bacterium]|nr:hypothetical protein [Nitrospirota bacterium]